MNTLTFNTSKEFHHWHQRQSDRFFILHSNGSLSPVSETNVKNVPKPFSLVRKDNLKTTAFVIEVMR